MSNHSLYKYVQDDSPKTKSLHNLFQDIKSDVYRQSIDRLRSKEPGKLRDKLKRALPAFTPSGTFGERRKLDNLEKYTGLISLDFDKVETTTLTKAKINLKEDKFVRGFFISPSGNGIKVFVQTSGDASIHSYSFSRVKKYIEDLIGLEADESCKDISRLCFVSHDPGAYLNVESTIFMIFNQNVVCAWEEALKIHSNEEGSRNNLVFAFAVICQVKGLDKSMCSEYAHSKTTLPLSEVTNAVKSAYKGDYSAIAKRPERNLGKYGLLEEFLDQYYKTRFNVITNNPEVMVSGLYQPLTDVIFHDILRHASKNHVSVSEASLKVVLNSGFAVRYNPYEEYFGNLVPWDGFDYIQELVDKLPFRDPNRAYLYITRWLTGIVACSLKDDETNQHMLVLVGAQGIGKTTFFNSLMPPVLKSYTFHGIIRPEDKDTTALLSDKLLIVVDELDTMRPHQLHQMKEVLTKPQITLRRPYARTSENSPRRASFAASVNNTDFLVDPTGNRRYLCLFVDGVIPYDLGLDINQLFSQALAYFEDGEPHWFNREEIAAIEEANQDFIQPLAEEELLLQTFDSPHEDDNYEKLSATEIAIQVANKHDFPISRLRPEIMGKMLVKNGFPSLMVKGAKKYKVVRVRV